MGKGGIAGKVAGAVVAGAAAAAGAWGAGTLLRRWRQQRDGVGTIPLPPMPDAPEQARRRGPFTARFELFSLLSPGDGRISVEVPWNDDWFFADPSVYNPDLSRTLAALAFVAVSESYHFKSRGGDPADMEAALAKLGFTDCRTHSYQYRSRPVDEVLGAFTDSVDVAAYAMARKDLEPRPGERPTTLLLVAVRGSYGSEWLSNVNLPHEDEEAAERAERAEQEAADVWTLEGVDHRGFELAAKEILRDLVDYTTDLQDRDVKLVVCGHSRGGSIANHVAGHVIRLAGTPFSVCKRENVFCYTIAAPTVTSRPDAQGPAFSGVFNICNPNDPVPRLPLFKWGYRRYGRDILLPGYGDDGFDERFAAMGDYFQRTVGAPVPYDPSDRASVNRMVGMLDERIPTRRAWSSPVNKLFFGAALLTQGNPASLFSSHYESVYLAWLQTLRTDGLTFLPPGEPLH